MTLPSTPNSTPTAPAPAGPATPAPAAFTPSTAPVRFPLDWLLAHGAAPLRYRALTEVAGWAAGGTLADRRGHPWVIAADAMGVRLEQLTGVTGLASAALGEPPTVGA